MTPDKMRSGFIWALKRAGEGDTLADLELALTSDFAALWIGERCALVTTLHEPETGRELHVWLGTGDLSEMITLEPGISAWARSKGCKSATIRGRKGWDRVFSKHGFTRDGDELRKLL